MRADRLISILLLLQGHGRLTARELAQKLEVSERTIHRDMEALSMAGIPVVAERGTNGGWSLLESYRTNLTGLKESEIQALLVNLPSRLLKDLGLEKEAEAAFIKLLAALPSFNRHSAQDIRNRIHIDVAGWHPSKESFPLLPVLQDAIWQERQLLICYQREDTTVERLCDPLGLVAKGSVWYLVAMVDGEIRTYRVSRIQDARLTDTPCTRPAGFDLAAYWQQSMKDFVANLPRYPITVRVMQEILPFVKGSIRFAKIEQVDPPDETGWQTIQVRFDVEEEACQFVLGFGSQMELLDPPHLREKILQMAKATVELYSS